MTKRKGKAVSFDAMVKFFMHNYNIPTKRDVDHLNDRLDRLEKLIRAQPSRHRRSTHQGAGESPQNATETVLALIKNSPGGIAIKMIRQQTGFDDKKLRNIIFRLNKLKKIKRLRRGLYQAVE